MPLWLLAILKSPITWGGLVVVLALYFGDRELDARYQAGVEDGRAACASAATDARVAEIDRLRLDAEARAVKESDRADRAYATAGVREGQARRVEESAVAQANADETCIQEETADAIRALQ